MKQADVSVIITTRDEEKNIAGCLRSIKEQSFTQDRIEIIVVDNNSTDKTKEIAKRFTPLVFNRGPERSAQRNFGAREARGKYLLFLDADMYLSPGVVGECVRLCGKDGYAGLYIPERIAGEGFWIKVRDFERSFYDGTVIDCVRFVTRAIFNEVEGFDENLTGPEDWDFDKKVRNLGSVTVIKSKLNHDERSFDRKRYFAKKRYYSRNIDAYAKKWGKDDSDIKKQLGAYYRFLGVFLERGKYIKLALHPILALGMYYLRLRVGWDYIMGER